MLKKAITWLVSSLRNKMIAGLSVFIVIALLLPLIASYQLSRAQLHRQTVVHVTDMANTLAGSSRVWMLIGDYAGLQEILDTSGVHHDVRFALFAAPDGRVIAHTDPEMLGKYLTEVPREIGSKTYTSQLELVDYLTPVVSESQHLGWVRLGISAGTEITALNQRYEILLVYSILVALLGIFIARVLAERLSGKLTELQRITQRVEEGDLQVRADIQGEDEPALLAGRINRMLDRLAEVNHSLKQSEQRVLRALDTGEIGLWSWDIQTNRLDWDDRAYQMYGLNREVDGELSYEVWRSMVHPDDLADAESKLQLLVAQGDNYLATFRILTGSGEVRYSEAAGYPEYGEDGTLERVIGFAKDVTDEKRAEQALRLERSRYRDIIRGTNAGTWEWNIQTGETVVNDRIVEMVGYTQTELAPVNIETWKRLVHPDDAEPSAQLLQEHFAHKSDFYEMEMRLKHKDGHWVWIMDRGRVHTWTDDGKPEWMSGTYTDISDLKKAQQEAVDASEAKSKFLAMMSHEIRTPMNGLYGLLQLALEEKEPEQIKGYILKSIDSFDLLRRVINDVLDFSKIESGKLELYSTPFDLERLIRGLGQVIGQAAYGQGLDFWIDLDPQLPRKLLGDEVRIKQILSNLLNNSVKFTKQGEIQLRISLGERSQTECLLLIEVSDTGIGMSPEQLERVFQPFAQADASITSRYGGTGLGLSIVKQLVEMMGGQIKADSVYGSGTRISLSLVLGCDPKTETLNSGYEKQIAQRGRVHPLYLRSESNGRIHDLCKRWGWESVPVASIGEYEAALAESDDPLNDLLILSEAELIDRDLLRQLRDFRQRFPAGSSYVVLVTTQRIDLNDHDLNELIDYQLIKPITPSTLFDALISRDSLHERESITKTVNSDNPLDGVRVLLAEDNPTNQLVARQMLARAGAKVVVAENGQLALDALAQVDNVFDLVLMDMQMPVMDGIEATLAIRGQQRFDQLPIIALTANAMTEDHDRCIAAGMNDHLAKPVNRDQLVETILRFLK